MGSLTYVIPPPYPDHPTVSMLLELLQGHRLRADIGRIHGCEVQPTDAVHARIPAA